MPATIDDLLYAHAFLATLPLETSAMRHARPDYERIQDPTGRIPDDEPVFIIRAQDKSAAETLRFWADENIRNDGDPELSRLAERWADKMDAWPKKKPADLKPRLAVEED